MPPALGLELRDREWGESRSFRAGQGGPGLGSPARAGKSPPEPAPRRAAPLASLGIAEQLEVCPCSRQPAAAWGVLRQLWISEGWPRSSRSTTDICCNLGWLRRRSKQYVLHVCLGRIFFPPSPLKLANTVRVRCTSHSLMVPNQSFLSCVKAVSQCCPRCDSCPRKQVLYV